MDVSKLYSLYPRIVGWGTGSFFSTCQHIFPIKLDYLVDNDPAKQGVVVEGVLVHSPNRLLDDLQANTLIIIYSLFHDEIRRQILQMGHFEVIPAGELYGYNHEYLKQEMELLTTVKASVKSRHDGLGIVVQGPIIKETGSILKFYRTRYPEARLILSSWQGEDDEAVQDILPYVDAYVSNRLPAQGPGVGNRNYQLVTTRKGIERAIELGAKHILKTRADMVLLADDVISRCQSVSESYSNEVCHSHNLSGRLVVPKSFTHKYRLYHASDMVMYGNAMDLLLYWSAPLDVRGREHPDFSNFTKQSIVDASCKSGAFAESYFGTSFCERIGREIKGTLEDSWAYYRDLFVVQDDAWFGMLWFKHKFIPGGFSEDNISHIFWLQLNVKDPTVLNDIRDVDNTLCTPYMIPS